jgi:hypothetical protein
VATPLLVSASALIGNARWATRAWHGWEEPPDLWLAAVGDSGARVPQRLSRVASRPAGRLLLGGEAGGAMGADFKPCINHAVGVWFERATDAWTAPAERLVAGRAIALRTRRRRQ